MTMTIRPPFDVYFDLKGDGKKYFDNGSRIIPNWQRLA
jgi:hypothetical protein